MATVAETLQQCDDLLSILDDDIDSDTHDKATEFFTSIEQSVHDVRDTIERLDRVSDRQATAINNWEAAVLKWIPD